MDNKPLEIWVDENGDHYANTRAEAFFKDQIRHISEQYGVSGLDEADQKRIHFSLGLISTYSAKLAKILGKLDLKDQAVAFDNLFLLTSGYFGVGALGTGCSKGAFQSYMKFQQSQTAREAAELVAGPRLKKLDEAVRQAAAAHPNRAMAISKEYAQFISPAVRRLLPKDIVTDKYPGVETIKNAVGRIRKQKKQGNA